MKSKGPPYKDPPGYKYVVVENPWPGLPGDKAMLPRIAIWLRYALNNTECPEMIFYRKSRGDVVVVQFPEDTDITPLLGAHYWPNFDRRPGAQTQGPKISSIFEFRYERHGHPEDHQWMGYVVDPGPPPSSMQPVPIKQPYPPPTWQSHVGKSCADLVLPIPPPRDEEEAQQPAPAAPPQPPPPERNSNSMYSFAEVLPDERPAPQTPAQAQTQPANAGPAPRRNEAPSAGSSTQTQRQQKPNLFGGKGDPYEAEETASRALKAEPIEGQPLTRVKPEPQNLIGEAAFAELQRVRALRAAQAAQAAQSRTTTADPATRASTLAPSQPSTSPAIPNSGSIETPPTTVPVKVESTAGKLPSASRSRDPRVQVKAEPRQEQVPRQEPGRSAPYRVKRELDEDDQVGTKRARTDTPEGR